MSNLKTSVKVILAVLVIAIVGGACWAFGLFGNKSVVPVEERASDKLTIGVEVPEEPVFEQSTVATPNNDKKENNEQKETTPKVRGRGGLTIAVDAYPGWSPLVYANKGLKNGRDNSIYKSLGIDVNLMAHEDDDAVLQKLIKGEIDGIAMTVNQWASSHAKLVEAGVGAKMVLITDRSTGGDAVVTTAPINSIENIVGHKMSMARGSVSHTVGVWFLRASSLTDTQVSEIINNIEYSVGGEATYENLKSGKADVAVLFEPYITMAKSELGAKVMVSTKSAPDLVFDGVIIREDIIKENPELVERFVEGTLKAIAENNKDTEYVRDFDDFADLSDKEILEMYDTITFANFADNREILSGSGPNLYKQMSAIWKSLGARSVTNGERNAFYTDAITALSSKFQNDKVSVTSISEADKNRAAIKDVDTEAIFKMVTTINFKPNMAIIPEESFDTLREFAEIANIMRGSVITIEGNIADTGVGNTEAGRILSENRAFAVYEKLIEFGVDENQMLYEGKGITKPVPGLDPKSEEGMRMNRRTDIFFLPIE